MTDHNQNLLALGFQHKASDNSYAKKIDSQFSIEVEESGKLFLVAAPIDMDIASVELTEDMVSSFREVMFKVKNQTAI